MENRTNIERTNLKNQLKTAKESISQLFEKLEKEIRAINKKVVIKDNQRNVVYKHENNNFAEIKIQTMRLRLLLRSVKYDDINGIEIQEVKASHRWGNKIKMYVKNEDELNIIMPLIERSYKDVDGF
jgi:predicted transport protein